MNIPFDFPLILTSVVIFSGVVSLIDILFLESRRKRTGKKKSKFVEYCRSFFPALLAVLIIRSFIIQPYRVPTGSLEPTVLPGDFIVVNQFAYGLRLPVLNTKIFKVSEPKLGDVVLFRWPVNPSIIFVKRVVGLPGDHLVYKNKILTINGKEAEQTSLGMGLDIEGNISVPAKLYSEILPNGVVHKIFVKNGVNEGENFDVVVPPNDYFVMGDNRDDSDDSRTWGFVPEKNLIGKAFGIWMNWDSQNLTIRWNRIGKALK